jgi:hypothetical protein
MIGLR